LWHFTSLALAIICVTLYFLFQKLFGSLYISGRSKYLRHFHHKSQHLNETLHISGPINYLRSFTSLVPTTTCEIVHPCSQQILESLYISESSNNLGYCTSLFRQLIETLYIKFPSNYMGQCTSVVPGTTWDNVHLWYQQLLEIMYISVSSN